MHRYLTESNALIETKMHKPNSEISIPVMTKSKVRKLNLEILGIFVDRFEKALS